MSAEQTAAPEPQPTERPFSPLLRRVVEMAGAEMQRVCNEAAQEEAQLLGLPEGTRLDIKRLVWVIPPAQES